MGYEGGELRPWFGTGPVKLAAIRMARDGGDRLTFNTGEKTPVGETGHLRASWKSKVVVILVNDLGETVYESGTETHVDYAPFVEWGTGLWGPKHAKYLIVPKKPGGWLHWIGPGGEDVFARKVWHPGSPGAHMVAIAVAATEAELHSLVEPILKGWAKEQEMSNPDARAGVI